MRDVELNPTKVVAIFQRCSNYPRDDDGVRALAQGLQRAANQNHVSMVDIVDRCREGSAFCPTDFDFGVVARELAAAAERPKETTKCPLGKCDGSGWTIVYAMHTHTENRVEKTNLTEAQYNDLCGKVDWKTQFCYSGARRCGCYIPAPKELAAPKHKKQVPSGGQS